MFEFSREVMPTAGALLTGLVIASQNLLLIQLWFAALGVATLWWLYKLWTY